MSGLVPTKILENRRKVGFDTPEADWLKLNGSKIRAIFASESFRKRSYFKQNEALIAFIVSMHAVYRLVLPMTSKDKKD